MIAKIVDLKKWADNHPPAVRLVQISTSLLTASLALQRNAWRAWFSLFVPRNGA